MPYQIFKESFTSTLGHFCLLLNLNASFSKPHNCQNLLFISPFSLLSLSTKFLHSSQHCCHGKFQTQWETWTDKKTIERSSSIMFDCSKPVYIFSLHLSSIQRLSARNRLVGCWPVMVGCLVAGSAHQKEGSVRLLPVTHYSATLTSPQTQKNHFYYIPQTRSPWMLENRCTGAHCVSGWQKLAAFPREQKWP